MAASTHSQGTRAPARLAVRFTSGDAECAAWHYPGTNGACIVMAGGLGVTKEPGTDRFAARFHAAGFSVLAFDYRGLGQSGGQPRQVVRVGAQLDDWRAAIAFARDLPEVREDRVALWGFSISGGHVLAAARNPGVAAAIAQTPAVGGPLATRHMMRHARPLSLLKLTARGLRDAVGGVLGRPPVMVALAGEPGEVALLNTPDAILGAQALDPDGRYPEWRQEVAARAALTIGPYQPSRHAKRIACPLLVVVCEDDASARPASAAAVARNAPHGELVTLRGNHYGPFMGEHDAVVGAELAFLGRTLDVPIPEDA